jgi:hypothetical protein
LKKGVLFWCRKVKDRLREAFSGSKDRNEEMGLGDH